MHIYHPSKNPDPAEWLNIDESERINLVRESHSAAQIEFEDEAESIHAVMHVIVENQLAMKVDSVTETVTKLTRQGLSRHESIHAVGAVLSEGIFNLLKGNTDEFDIKKYRKRLQKLTAKRWNKGQW